MDARAQSGAPQAGFTLMELLIAMALASIVGVTLYGLTSAVMDAYDHSRTVRRQDFGFTMIGEVLRADLQGVYPGGIAHEDFLFVGDSYGGSDAPFLSFATSATLDLKSRDEQMSLFRVEYLLEQDEDEDFNNLVRRERHWPGVSSSEEWTRIIVARGIEKFSIQYARPDSKNWVSDWKSAVGSELKMWNPYAVQITVSFVHSPDVEQELVVLLPTSEFKYERPSI